MTRADTCYCDLANDSTAYTVSVRQNRAYCTAAHEAIIVLDLDESSIYYLQICLFFFFQAEDGIRDSSVTGVQTCALPICSERAFALSIRCCNPLFQGQHGKRGLRERGVSACALSLRAKA